MYVSRKRTAALLLGLFFLLTACDADKKAYHLNESDDKRGTAAVTIGELEENIRTDVVLVMDESDSMKRSDRERIALEGAKLFVDMEKLSNAGIGLVEFSDGTAVTQIQDVGRQESKEKIKEILNQVQYGGYTDTGAALLEAVKVLDGSETKNNKSIILFTDGEIDINPGLKDRSIEISKNDVDTAVQQAQEKGYTIYCIGLNADGAVDEEMLAEIASATGGEYLIAEDVSAITDFFETFFASIGDADIDTLEEYTADGDYHTVRFQIDNANILEANIIILSSKEIEDIYLSDATGDRDKTDLLNSDRFVFSSSKKYTMVKLIRPDVGEWSISVKGVSGDAIKIAKIFNYDINLIIDVDNTELTLGESCTVKAYFASEGKRIVDRGFYGGLQGEVTWRNQDTEESGKQSIGVKNENGVEAKLQPEKTGTYSFTVHVQGSGFYRDSDEITLKVTKQPPKILKDIPPATILVGKEYKLDLEEYFADPDGEELSYAVETGSENLSAELEGATLTLKNEVSQQVQVAVHAINGALSDASLKFMVTTESMSDRLKRLIPVSVAAGILILTVILVLRSKKMLYGAFKVEVESCGMDENGAGKRVTYEISNVIQANLLGKHGFKLKRLLKLLPGYYFDFERKPRFEESVSRMEAAAGKIRFCGSRKPFEMKVKGAGQGVKFVENNVVSSKKTLAVFLRNKMPGTPVMEKKFGIRIENGDGREYDQLNFTYRKQ